MNREFQPGELEGILDDAWLDLKVDEEKLFNPLENIPAELEDEPYLYIMWLFNQPEYFSFFCKEIMNISLLPMQALILKEIWNRKFPMFVGCRGVGKSFLLGLYALMRLTLIPGRRIVICGAAFRQSKIISNYMESIWGNAPLLRSMVGPGAGPRHEPDMYRFHVGESMSVSLPIGTGEKIRGQRANDLIVDEFSSLSREIFETVLSGFLSVKSGPADSVRERSKRDLANRLGVDLAPVDDPFDKSNQLVISGTAFYEFNHFAEYWKRWKKIIHSKGDPHKLMQAFDQDEVDVELNWKDYSIIRIPYGLIPKGFMDDAMISRARATIHSGIFDMEYGATFSSDSNGFFKRSLIESCVINNSREISYKDGVVDFNPILVGNPKLRYVYGVDPASEIDNFAIVVIEMHADHRRIVHVWTTNKADHREKLKAGLVAETDFYGYCARKIRNLMRVFPCERIVIDSQGGGVAVSEALHDKDKLQDGEHFIWPVVNPDKPDDLDIEIGLHLIEMANFSSADWTSQANHGLRKDFEDKVCLFPRFDPALLELAAIKDHKDERLYDTLEDCVMEIEELKDELSTIIIEQTPSGRDRWMTPEVKLPGNKKGYLRKDRYSALVMANMGARIMARTITPTYHISEGNFVTGVKTGNTSQSYVGPQWFTDQMEGIYD